MHGDTVISAANMIIVLCGYLEIYQSHCSTKNNPRIIGTVPWTNCCDTLFVSLNQLVLKDNFNAM